MKKILCICLVLSLCCALAACNQSQRFKLTITDNSMVPTFSEGDTIIYEPVDPDTLQVGDIIAFWMVVDSERVVQVHRIVNIYDLGENLLFETRGDNAANSDAMPVHESNVLGKYVRTLIFGFF